MERIRDAATIELLKNLRVKLFSENISVARVAAFNLSWMQEDGLTILKEAILGNYSRTVKKASAYGLRNMRGRMKKMAIEVLEQGQQSQDKMTQEACAKSLFLIQNKPAPRPKQAPRRKIKELPHKGGNVPQQKSGNSVQYRGGSAQPRHNENALPYRNINGGNRGPSSNHKPPRRPGNY